jgi:hypothetical protein
MVSSRDDRAECGSELKESPALGRHPVCGHVKLPPADEMLVARLNPKAVLTLEPIWGSVVMRTDLIEFLGFDKAPGYHLGRIRQRFGEVFRDHRTVWSNEQVLIRGEKGSLRGTCEHCTRVFYFPWGNDWYVTQASVAGVEAALADGPASLVVNAEAGGRLQEMRLRGPWKQLRLWPIKVREHAADGLPDDYQRPREYH